MNLTNPSHTIYVEHIVILATFFVLIAFVGSSLNILLIFMILWCKTLRNDKSNLFLLMHTISDTILSIFVVPSLAYRTINHKNYDSQGNNPACKFFVVIKFSCIHITILALAAMSLERYLAIAKPYFYHRKVTLKVVIISIISISVYAVLSTSPLILKADGVINKPSEAFGCTLNMACFGKWYSTYVTVCIFVIPTGIIGVCNYAVFKIARSHHTKIKSITSVTMKYKHHSIKAAQRHMNSRNTLSKHVQKNVITELKSQDNDARLPDHITSENMEIQNNPTSTNINALVKAKNTKDGKISVSKGSSYLGMSTAQNANRGYDVAKSDNYNMLSNSNGSIRNESATHIPMVYVENTIMKSKLKDQSKSNLHKQNNKKKTDWFEFKENNQIAISTLLLVIVLGLSQMPFIIILFIKIIDKQLLTSTINSYAIAATLIVPGLNPIVVILSRRIIRRRLFLFVYT